jgi:hypothetical protein
VARRAARNQRSVSESEALGTGDRVLSVTAAIANLMAAAGQIRWPPAEPEPSKKPLPAGFFGWQPASHSAQALGNRDRWPSANTGATGAAATQQSGLNSAVRLALHVGGVALIGR